MLRAEHESRAIVAARSVFPFIRGRTYRRKDIFRIVGLPDATKGGDWTTGYARLESDYFIFCNIGVAGRTGHDYANRWSEGDLIWYAKNGTRKNQPTIQRMTSGAGRVYVFWRDDNRAPFTFAGLAVPRYVEDCSPVRVIWGFPDGVANHQVALL